MRTFGFGLPLAAVAILAVACGGGSTSAAGATTTTAPTTTTAATTTTTTTTTSAAASSSASASASALTLRTARGSAGIWLTGVGGRALYGYTVDQGAKSNCYGACATAWPPLTATGSVSVTGQFTAQKFLGVTTRTDGTKQVTYGGHPLYYYQGDKGPGQIKGQGVGGVWFLIGPVGNVMNGKR